MARFAVKTLEFDKIKERLARKAATSLGKQKALAVHSESEFGLVQRLLTETDEALRLFDMGKRFPFGGAGDIIDAIKRAQLGSVLDAEALMLVGSTAAAIRQMKSFLQGESEMAPNLAGYAAGMQVFTRLEKQLENAISEKGEIKDSASTKLGGLRNGIAIAKSRVKEKLDSILHSPEYQKYFQEQLVTMRGDRYVIPIKQEYKFNFPGVVHDQSGSGATLFIEPMAVVNLNNDIKKYLAQEKEEIERILRQLSGAVGAEANDLASSLGIFTDLDVICAKAYLAQEQKAVRPMMLVNGYIDIHQGRHPLLKQEEVVPLDIKLGEKFNTLLITGPNTGGKTVALKTVGLFALMAQAGLFVPAKLTKLPVFRAIFADIGDEQSIEQSLSTFSGHLRNIVEILNEVREKDLVLIDEICAGTDPNEGAALAMSILDHLHKKDVFTIITTHYSELKTFAYEHVGMENASVEFDPVSLRPTYRLLMGVPGSSNAFYISKRLGLSQEILDKAGQMLTQEHLHMEDVLQNLEGERRQYELQNKEIEVMRFESEKIKQELLRKKTDLDKRRNEMLRKAREEADEVYRKSRREAEEIMKELRAMKKEFDVDKMNALAEEARKKLAKTFDFGNAPAPEGKTLATENARPGQVVYLSSLAQNGTIVEVNGNNVVVQIGAMKTTVPIKKCLLLSETKKVTASEAPKMRKGYAHDLFVSKNESVPTEIDVRGMTVEEAIPVIDKVIDDAMLAGAERIRIIHGKGTGMLRFGLTGYLSGHRAVKRIEAAPLNEGGTGATIVFFR
ncbi:MAG: endonuclease MutS2 [Negativicutes bacterium]|nr:endonuclease MutS2 [Negativicutes bacterium]